MGSQDIPLEDIVLLLSSSVEESPGICDPCDQMSPYYHRPCPAALSEVFTASTDSDLSDLDSVLSQQLTEETKHQQLSQWTQLEQEWQTHTDLPSTRRRRKDDTVVYAKRLGKDEKLAKEAQIPFTVKTLVSLPMDE